MRAKNTRVAVAMSGGVDSSVSAALLKEAGFEVVGVYMKNWSGSWGSCDANAERRDALKVALKLGIPLVVFDLEDEYRREVMDRFFAEYRAGRTPNPDVLCNKKIKFGLFWKRAKKELGANCMATGHYARRQGNGKNSRLLRGKDKNKDQSYFLWAIPRPALAATIFPVGEMTKEKVRQMARERGLAVAEKPDSQGICFVGEADIEQVLKAHLGERPGKIVNVKGKVLGEHLGAHLFTIGQRQGLKIGGGIPYYVVDKDMKRNWVIVAPLYHPALFKKEMVVGQTHWLEKEPELPLGCEVQVRYQQPAQKAVVERQGKEKLQVRFEQEQRAITPGQSAVFYQGEQVLGGGVIEN